MKISTRLRLPSAALLAVLPSCSGDSPTGAGREPARVQAVAGSGQAGTAGTVLATTLVAKVTDRGGNGVPGVTVTWTVDPAGGTLAPVSTPTDSAGEARTRWTLGPGAGTFTATASAPGLPPAAFTATSALPPVPARVDRVGGDGQAAAVGTALADSLAVRVTSAEGRPVPGARVSWAVSGGGGTMSDSVRLTDAEGIAKVRWILGIPTGTQTVEARVPGLAGSPVAFRATALPGSAASLARMRGHDQVGFAGRALGDSLVVRVTDRFGHPVRDASVRWIAMSGGGSLSPETGSTDSLGLARAAWTLGAMAGENTAHAKLGDVSLFFSAVAVLPAPVATVAVSPAAASAPVGDTVRLAATLRAADGSLLPSDQVAWSTSAPAVASVSASGTVVGRGAGTATITASAGGRSGTSVVTITPAAAAPPKLTGLVLGPSGVDVTDAPATVEVLVSAQASRGFDWVTATVVSQRTFQDATCAAIAPAGDTATSATWTCRLTIPRSSASGTWLLDHLTIRDRAGTSRDYRGAELQALGLPAELWVRSLDEDVRPPTLTAFSLSHGSLDLSAGARTLEVTFTGTDEETGIQQAVVRMRAPGAPPGSFSGQLCNTSRLDGTAKTATMKCSIGFGQSAAAGTWQVDQVTLFDAVRNKRFYGTADLQAAGFPTTLTITR